MRRPSLFVVAAVVALVALSAGVVYQLGRSDTEGTTPSSTLGPAAALRAALADLGAGRAELAGLARPGEEPQPGTLTWATPEQLAIDVPGQRVTRVAADTFVQIGESWFRMPAAQAAAMLGSPDTATPGNPVVTAGLARSASLAAAAAALLGLPDPGDPGPATVAVRRDGNVLVATYRPGPLGQPLTVRYRIADARVRAIDASWATTTGTPATATATLRYDRTVTVDAPTDARDVPVATPAPRR